MSDFSFKSTSKSVIAYRLRRFKELKHIIINNRDKGLFGSSNELFWKSKVLKNSKLGIQILFLLFCYHLLKFFPILLEIYVDVFGQEYLYTCS